MDLSEQEERNVNAIRRVDPTVISLIHYSNYVALYNFNVEKTCWDKTNIEGPFFIYKKQNPTEDKNLNYSGLITSRNSLEHFQLPIIESLKYKLEENIIIFMTQPSNICIYLKNISDVTRKLKFFKFKIMI